MTHDWREAFLVGVSAGFGLALLLDIVLLLSRRSFRRKLRAELGTGREGEHRGNENERSVNMNGPKKFRKKVEVEALQWTGENDEEILGFAQQRIAMSTFDGQLSIRRLKGVVTASIGDWIIREINGEFYTCKPDIFPATYEPV